MIRKRDSLTIHDFRQYLNRTGDISIGAYARRQRRQRIYLGVFGAVLIAAALTLYWQLRPSAAVERPLSGLWQVVACTRCGAVEELRVDPSATYPFECRKCRQRTLRPYWRCGRCERSFIWPREGQKVTDQGPICPTPGCPPGSVYPAGRQLPPPPAR